MAHSAFRHKRLYLRLGLAQLILSRVQSRNNLSSLPLGAVRAFEAASRLGSFKAAAAELSVTPAAISHQIKALEGYLGGLLFDRLHRSLRLTRLGKRFAIAAQDAFELLRSALAELRTDGLAEGPTTLSVSAASSFAAKWLAPRLHRFQALYPSIELHLRAEDALVDLVHDPRIDVALRYGMGPYADALHAEPLWPPGVVCPVCAPFADWTSEIVQPENLVHQTLLRTMSPPGPAGTSPIGWAAFFDAAGISGTDVELAITRAPLFGTTQLALEAAAAGHGVALSPKILVEEDIVSRRLIRPCMITIPDPFSYWLIYRDNRAQDRHIRAFAAWIKSEVNRNQHEA